MSNEVPKNEFANVQPGVPPLTEQQAHVIATDMRAHGVARETVDSHLKSLGYAPLDASPQAEATRELSALKNDPEWIAKLNRGDAEAEATFSRLTLAMSQPGTTETAPRPDDYRFAHHVVKSGASEKDVDAFNQEHAQWAAKLGLSQEAANALVSMTLDGAMRLAGLTPDQAEQFGHEQTAMLNRVLSSQGDPEARVKAAQTILKLVGGRDIDIARVARQGGAEMALELVLQAERIARGRQ